MSDQVQEFLRRVAEMRAQAAAQAQGQPPPAPPKPPRQQPPPRLVPAPPPALAAPVVAEIVDAELSESSSRVARRVAEDLRGSERIAEHSRHLADDVEAADDKMEARLHQVFDHQLGRFKPTEAVPTAINAESAPPEFSLGSLQRLLRSPNSLRDAIILTEILKRPEF